MNNYEEYFTTEEDALSFQAQLIWLQDDFVTRVFYDDEDNLWVVEAGKK